MEGLLVFSPSVIRCSCLSGIQQSADDTGVVDCHLCFQCHLGVYPHKSLEASESSSSAQPEVLASPTEAVHQH